MIEVNAKKVLIFMFHYLQLIVSEYPDQFVKPGDLNNNLLLFHAERVELLLFCFAQKLLLVAFDVLSFDLGQNKAMSTSLVQQS